MPRQTEIFVNGVDLNGQPILAPLSREELVGELRKSLLRPKEEFVPGAKAARSFRSVRAFFQDLRPAHDPAQAGWALLMHKDDEARLRPLLEPLVTHRKSQMQGNGRVEVHIFDQNQPPEVWLRQHVVGSDHPYYNLIAASPGRISFRFQNSLDVRCAVGRLWFETDEEFRNYVNGILTVERSYGPIRAPKAFIFAPDHDEATHISRSQMVAPLLNRLATDFSNTEYSLGPDAIKGKLRSVLSRQDKPALVFTASHGLAIRQGDPAQQEMQGSLVCQDSRTSGYFGGSEIDAQCNLYGGIFFSFACYGAGTPSRSDFWHWIQEPSWQAQLKMYEAPSDFLANLPTRLLGTAKPALAFVGHIDPAWTYSFLEPTTEEQRIYPFQAALMRILQGLPVGYAVKEFNEEYATLNADLLNMQIEYEQMHVQNQQPAPFWDTQLADVWMRRTDYQNYILLGDPAARIGAS